VAEAEAECADPSGWGALDLSREVVRSPLLTRRMQLISRLLDRREPLPAPAFGLHDQRGAARVGRAARGREMREDLSVVGAPAGHGPDRRTAVRELAPWRALEASSHLQRERLQPPADLARASAWRSVPATPGGQPHAGEHGYGGHGSRRYDERPHPAAPAARPGRPGGMRRAVATRPPACRIIAARRQALVNLGIGAAPLGLLRVARSVAADPQRPAGRRRRPPRVGLPIGWRVEIVRNRPARRRIELQSHAPSLSVRAAR
jgi:hypothetical protein